MAALIALVNLAGLIVFATLLWSSRARVAGLAAFGLALTPFLFHLAGPPVVSLGSAWDYCFRLAAVLALAGNVVLLGAVYALRPNPSLPSAERERTLLRVVGTLVVSSFAFASLFLTWFFFAEHATGVVVLLLALAGMLIRWGVTPVGLVGAAGFGLMALTDLVYCLARFTAERRPPLPPELLTWVTLTGLAAVVTAFVLASRTTAVQQKPYPGVETIGMNRARWVGIVLVVVGAVLFLALSYAIGEMKILKGLRGRAAILGALLPAAGLYLVLIGTVRLTTGQAVWGRKDL